MLVEENEQEMKQVKEMQKLMHVFSHDLRNPLLNINALVHETDDLIQDIKDAHSSGQQQTLDHILNTELPEILAMLKQTANRMDEMVLGANDISHCMFDELEHEVIDMQDMFRRCFLRLKLDDSGFQLLNDGGEQKICADPLAVQRVVTELLDNASKAVEANQAVKSLQIRSKQDAQFIWFEVEDSGCGFADNELAHVFTPFFSGKNFNTGAGMGLARVKAWVEHHSGSVSAESGYGKTVVSFSLPKAG